MDMGNTAALKAYPVLPPRQSSYMKKAVWAKWMKVVREVLSVQDEARHQQLAVGSARIVEKAVVFVLIISCSYDMIFHLHGMTLRKENRAP